MADFEGGSAHLPKAVSKAVRVALIEGVARDSTPALLIVFLLDETRFLFDSLRNCASNKLHTKKAEMEDSGSLGRRDIPLFGRKFGSVLPQEEELIAQSQRLVNQAQTTYVVGGVCN